MCADYYGMCRSNYFRVKDEEEFEKFCGRYGLDKIEGKNFCVGFMSDGPLPNGEDVDGNPIDFERDLSKQLAKGEVAIAMEIGNEKMRYFGFYAFAVDSNGKTVTVTQDDIYGKAKKKWKKEISRAEY